MKKTLIALAALAMVSVAQAATIDDALVNTTTITKRPGSSFTGVTAPSYSDSYTWIAVMDWEEAVTNKGLNNWDDKARIYATDGKSEAAAVGAVFFRNNENGVAIQFAEYEGGAVYGGLDGSAYTTTFKLAADNGNYNAINLDKDTYVNKGKLALTFSYNDSTKVYTFGALTATGDLHTFAIAKESTWDVEQYTGVNTYGTATSVVEHFMWFDSALSTTDIAAIAAKAVPEPATATLSLLALAGLAARRRRK